MDGTRGQSAHLVGVCGAGMKALTELLLDLDWQLSGSDLLPPTVSIQKCIDRGLIFHQGHAADNVPVTTDQVIYSPAVATSNPERQEALRRRCPQFSYGQLVGRLMAMSTGVCIAGTHGKSTTTAMTVRVLEAAGRLSGVVVGAELCDDYRSGWIGTGDLFVAESCEFQGTFLEFQPKFSAILGIEPDHFDCYPDTESLESAFQQHAEGIVDGGLLLINTDCAVSRRVSATATTTARRVSFGLGPQANWSAENCRATTAGQHFTLTHDNQPLIEIELKVSGRHNVMNALAAAALCAEIGVDPPVIREQLARFPGIRRRFEYVGEWSGVTFIDDYAHHPTAVQVTLQTLRNLVGNRRILCVFQPHQVLRTTTLMDEFSASFANADQVWLAPVFAAREPADDRPRLVSEELGKRIAARGVPARAFASLDQIVITLEDATRPGDVIVTMGAGDIDRIHHEFTRRVQSDSPAG